MNLDRLWGQLLDQAVLTLTEHDTARARLQRKGGTPDTAILEVRPLSRAGRRRLLEIAADISGRPVAPRRALEHPDPDAVALVPPALARHHAIMATGVDGAHLEVVAPLCPDHVLSELEFVLGRPLRVALALEADIREALARFMGIPLSPRFQALIHAPPTTRTSELVVGQPGRLTPPGGFRVVNLPPPPQAPSRRVVLRLDAPDSMPPVARPPEPSPVIEPHLQRAVARLSDPRTRDEANRVLAEAGEDALAALIDAFPGPLRLDRFATHPAATPIATHGLLLERLLALGEAAVPDLLDLTDHRSPEVRYYAVFAFTALPAGPALSHLEPRLFDADPTVRVVTRLAASMGHAHPAFSGLIERLGEAARRARPARRRMAIEALAGLRQFAAGLALVDVLTDPIPEVVEAAHRALVELTLQSLGVEPGPWRDWLRDHAQTPRPAVLIDALASDQRTIRANALRQLVHLAGRDLGYRADLSLAQRAAAIERWRRWWSDQGVDAPLGAR